MKRFSCYWSTTAYLSGHSLETADFFTVSMGYDPQDIADIVKLELGETWMSEDSAHIITRVE